MIEIMIESPTRSNMTDHEYTFTLPTEVQILKKVIHSMDSLPPAFAVGIGLIQVLSAIAVEFSGWHAI